MNPEETQQLRTFLTSAGTLMGSIPLPVPPRAPDGWAGAILEAREFFHAFNRLPPELQEAASSGFLLCMDALERQGNTAHSALIAHYKLFTDLVQSTGTSPEVLFPRTPAERRRAQRYLTLVADDEPDPDDEMLAEVHREICEQVRRVLAHHDADVTSEPTSDEPTSEDGETARAEIPDSTTPDFHDSSALQCHDKPHNDNLSAGLAMLCIPRRLAAAAAAAAVFVMALVLSLTVFSDSSTPQSAHARTVSIDRSLLADDMPVIVSHAEHSDTDAAVHVHVVNPSDEERSTEIAINTAAGAVNHARVVVAAGATQHTVIKVPKGHKNDTIKSIQASGEFGWAEEMVVLP